MSKFQRFPVSGLLKTTGILFFVLVAVGRLSAAGLSGTYTIDKNKAASASNYISFNDADSDLTLGARASGGTANGPGVSNAVTFSIADGSYHESLAITAITGASSTNTITFQSASKDSSKVVLWDSAVGTFTSPTFILHLDNASFITFHQLTFMRVINPAVGTFFTYDNVIMVDNISDSNTISNCGIIGDYNITNNNRGALICSGNIYSFVFSLNQYNTFKNNYLKDGFYGITWFGNAATATPADGNTFDHNIIDSVGTNGLWSQYQSNFRITNNNIMQPDGGFGIDAQNIGAGPSKISSLIANNFVSIGRSKYGASNVGIYAANLDSTNIVYNNVNIYGSGASSMAAYIMPSGTTKALNIYNNNFINNNTAANDYALFGNFFTTEDYDNLKTNGANLVDYNTITYANLTKWKGLGKFAKHDSSVNPIYVSNTDLHVNNPALNGVAKPLAYDSTDIDGDFRNPVTPDIGADEFSPDSLQPGVNAITNPANGFCIGAVDVYVTLSNLGFKTITSANIKWSVNGTAQISYSWTGTLASGMSVSVKVGTYSFTSPASPYTIVAYPDSANGVLISSTARNTSTISVIAGKSGTYTIDNSGKGSPDYTSIAAAINDLNKHGICGATIFKIADGSYNESLHIGNIAGAAPGATATFQSASRDSSKVIIWDSVSGGTSTLQNYVLRLDNAGYLTFKQLTFMRTAGRASAFTYFDNVVMVDNVSDNDTFTGCRFLGNRTATPQNVGALVYSTSSNDEYNAFIGNYMSNAQYAFNWFGTGTTVTETGNLFQHNKIDSIYLDGFYMFYQDNVSVIGNNISMPFGYFGMYTVGINTTTSKAPPSLIANNFISVGMNANVGNNVGIYINTYDQTNVVFNNVNIYGSGSGTYGAYLLGSTGAKAANVYDNNLINQNTTASDYAFGGNNITAEDYDNLLSAGSNLVLYNAVTYATLAKWKATGKGKNDKSLNPLYISNTDLHVNNPLLDSSGKPLSYVLNDIDGDIRSTTKPDIGADEFTPAHIAPAITAVTNPGLGFCPGTQNVNITLSNYGTDTLTKALIKWSVNGTAQTPYSWTGKIAPASSATITIGTYSFSASGSYAIVAYPDSANSTAIVKALWNTATVNIIAGLSGSYSIDNSGSGSPNYTSFRAAVADIYKHGICGATIFNVADGTYNESLALTAISGVSAAKTVTFQSKSLDSTKVTLDTAWSGSATGGISAPVIFFNGVSYVNFRKMTIINNSAGVSNSFAHAVAIAGGAGHITLENDILYTDPATTNSGAAVFDYYNSVENYITLRYNHISGGFYGVQIAGIPANPNPTAEKGIVITNNVIDSCYGVGVIAWYTDSLIIKNNKIFMTAGSFGGLYILNNAVGLKDTALIINNFLTMTGATASALIVTNHKLINVFNNSITTDASNAAASFTNSVTGTYYVNSQDNIFFNSGSGDAISGVTAALKTSNYNDLYSASGNVGTWNGTACAALSDWQKTSKKDKSSVSGDPAFFDPSTGDLHLTLGSTVVRHMGNHLGDVPRDIDGQLRNATTPDIGADELSKDSNDIGVSVIIKPVGGSCGSKSTVVEVRVSNYGLNDQASYSVKVVVNGATSATVSNKKTLVGALTTGGPVDDTLYASFSPALNTTAGGTYNIVAYTILKSDTNTANDTSKSSITLTAIPVAKFSIKSSGACQGDSFYITDNSTTSSTATYSYTLLDSKGNTVSVSTAKSPSIYAATLGSYTLWQKVSNSTCTDSSSQSVTIWAKPKANFTIGTACVGVATQFTDSTVWGSGAAGSYSWTFGDGNTGSTSKPTNKYANPGSYSIHLKVKDANACTDTITKSIRIDTVNAHFTHTIPADDGAVSFRAADTTLNYYSWDFGDTSTNGSGFKSAHKYATNNTYTVALLAKNTKGCSATVTESITITITGINTLAAESFGMQVYPNPFREQATISFSLEKSMPVKVEVYDQLGRSIATLMDKKELSGNFNLNFRPADYTASASGIFTIRLVSGDHVVLRQIIMAR